DADMVLVVRDASRRQESLTTDEAQQDARLLELVSGRESMVVWNKIDAADDEVDADGALRTSALTGEGIDGLRSAILQRVAGDAGVQREAGFLTNVRQKQLVADSIAALDQATAAVPLRIPHEMLLLDLYNALRALDEITGATTADDILNLIFSSFCIGK